MAHQTKPKQSAMAMDFMTTAAAAAALNARSRAFSNTVAKANLAKASAALSHAKQLSSNAHETSETTISSK